MFRLWEMSMTRILITGSTGYLGSRAIAQLAARGEAELFGIDLNSPRDVNHYSVFRQGSVTDADAMGRLFDTARPDVAVHLAFVVNPLHDRAREEMVDREGTRTFLDECAKHEVKRVIVVTSVAAYGAHPDNDVPLTEKSPIRGTEGYAYSWMKAEVDRMVQDYAQLHSRSEVVTLRPCLIVGPNTNNAFFDIMKYPVVPQPYEAGETRDVPFQFIHEDEMAACLVEAITKPGIKGVYNIAAEGTVDFSELVRLSGKKSLPVPLWLLKPVAKLLWLFRISKVPAGQLDFVRFPWIMDATRMKAELYIPPTPSSMAFEMMVK